jgi:hypothetical protein
VSGPLSIADIALFPHLASANAMDVEFSAQEHPNLARWFKQMRMPICLADLKRTRDYLVNLKELDIEKRRIFWRGDRIEWMLARGFHAWFFNEIEEERVAWPGPALPAPMKLNAESCKSRERLLADDDKDKAPSLRVILERWRPARESVPEELIHPSSK